MSLEKFINLPEILSLDDDVSAEYYSVALDVGAIYTGSYCESRSRLLNLKDTGKVILDCWGNDFDVFTQGKKHGYNYRMRFFN